MLNLMLLIPSCTLFIDIKDKRPDCGNGIFDENEICDGTNSGDNSCIKEGFSGGQISVNRNILDTFFCTNDGDYGNGIINTRENCDGTALNGKTCLTVGFDSGGISRSNNCTFDTS